MRNFRTLKIWTNGIELVKEVYRIAALLPDHERYGLKSQICRAAVSIPSNIAEGCSRSSEKEFKRYLEISMGSLFETETLLVIIQQLNMIEEPILSQLFDNVITEQKMVISLIEKIKATAKS